MKITINIRPNYIFIAGVALIVWTLGGYFAWSNMQWYETLKKPTIVPPTWLIRDMWRIIFPLTTFASIWVWNKFERDINFWIIIGLFAINAFLNIYWCYLFFVQHYIKASVFEAILLEITILSLIYFISRQSKLIALLLFPYAGWVGFATVLNILIWQIN